MKILTKKFIVVYRDGVIISVSEDNLETYVGEDSSSAEFDTKKELDEFVSNNSLHSGIE